MSLSVGGSSPAGSGRALSDSASLDAQIAGLKKKRNDLVAEKMRLRASGGSAEEIAAIERRIKIIEERLKRLEERKLEEQRRSAAAPGERRPAPAGIGRMPDVRI